MQVMLRTELDAEGSAKRFRDQSRQRNLVINWDMHTRNGSTTPAVATGAGSQGCGTFSKNPIYPWRESAN